jgi:hypothetical protein
VAIKLKTHRAQPNGRDPPSNSCEVALVPARQAKAQRAPCAPLLYGVSLPLGRQPRAQSGRSLTDPSRLPGSTRSMVTDSEGSRQFRIFCSEHSSHCESRRFFGCNGWSLKYAYWFLANCPEGHFPASPPGDACTSLKRQRHNFKAGVDSARRSAQFRTARATDGLIHVDCTFERAGQENATRNLIYFAQHSQNGNRLTLKPA